MGDTAVDVENEVLKAEQALRLGQGDRGDVTILPTLIINNAQYRGIKGYMFRLQGKNLTWDLSKWRLNQFLK